MIAELAIIGVLFFEIKYWGGGAYEVLPLFEGSTQITSVCSFLVV